MRCKISWAVQSKANSRAPHLDRDDHPGRVLDADGTSGVLLALAAIEAAENRPLPDGIRVAAREALPWLVNLANRDGGKVFPAAPIGLYFAKLLYDEALYPPTFTVTAFERAARLLDSPARPRIAS